MSEANKTEQVPEKPEATVDPAQPVAPAVTTEKADKPGEPSEADALKKRIAEYEAKERAAEQAKLSEAERLKSERDDLERERFRFDLQKSGIPPELAEHFAPVAGKKRAEAIEAIGKAFAAAVKAQVPAAPAAPAKPANPIIPAPTTKAKTNPYAEFAKSMSAGKR